MKNLKLFLWWLNESKIHLDVHNEDWIGKRLVDGGASHA